jgi:hypothetical protein
MRYHALYGDIIEVKNAAGQGLRYTAAGQFMGFL